MVKDPNYVSKYIKPAKEFGETTNLRAAKAIVANETENFKLKYDRNINNTKRKKRAADPIKREEDLVVQSAYRELLTAHPDFNELKDIPEFLEWLEGQPPSISDGITKNNKDSKWAIRVLDLYKADKGLSKSKPKSNASAAESVTRTKAKSVNVDGNTSKKVWKASEIQKMNPAMYEKYEKEIDLAFKEGRIDTRA